ncbi:response regulator transcription factor [Spirillospora sp. CA-255316]
MIAPGTGAGIGVLLADAQLLVRAGLRALLDGRPGLRVVAETAAGAEAVRLAARLRPEVVLMDVRLDGGVDGIAATRRITAAVPGVQVIIVTSPEREEGPGEGMDALVRAALGAGAAGFLLKDTEPAHLVRAIRSVAAGGAQLSPRITRRLITELAERLAAPPPALELGALTGREREIMELVTAGLTNDEISARLAVTRATVKTHVSRILVKTGVANRAQLVRMAYETGLVRPRWLLHGSRHASRSAAAGLLPSRSA